MKDSRPVRQGGVIMSGGSGITSRRGLFAAAGAALLASATACSGAGDTQALGEPGDGQQTTLMVFAAASLQDPFEEIGAEFEAAHEGFGVVFRLTDSTGLVTIIMVSSLEDMFSLDIKYTIIILDYRHD